MAYDNSVPATTGQRPCVFILDLHSVCASGVCVTVKGEWCQKMKSCSVQYLYTTASCLCLYLLFFVICPSSITTAVPYYRTRGQ